MRVEAEITGKLGEPVKVELKISIPLLQLWHMGDDEVKKEKLWGMVKSYVGDEGLRSIESLRMANRTPTKFGVREDEDEA